VRLQEVQGEITAEKTEEIFSDITEMVEEIKAGENEDDFKKNLSSCFNFGKCEWFNYCKNNDDTGLEFKK